MNPGPPLSLSFVSTQVGSCMKSQDDSDRLWESRRPRNRGRRLFCEETRCFMQPTGLQLSSCESRSEMSSYSRCTSRVLHREKPPTFLLSGMGRCRRLARCRDEQVLLRGSVSARHRCEAWSAATVPAMCTKLNTGFRCHCLGKPYPRLELSGCMYASCIFAGRLQQRGVVSSM